MNIARLCFWLTAVAGSLLVWLAPHPPMIDLPQHAGQLALLRQMWLGASPWAGLFEINPYTPYLLGFGLALPLSLVLPVAAAMKLLLSLAYLAFVAMCVQLRKQFGADPRTDWLCLAPFYGFAFAWGFFTFLVAAPLGLLLVLLAHRHAVAPTWRRGLALSITGLLLLVSHGLVFLFAMATAAALTLVQLVPVTTAAPGRARVAGGLRAALQLGWPLLLPTLALGAYYVARGRAEQAYGVPVSVPGVLGHWGIRHEVLGWAFGLRHSAGSLAGAAVLLAGPWLMGLRPALRNSAGVRPAWVLFVLLMVVLCAAPSFVFETSFVYERFSLFLFPAYAWLFVSLNTRPEPQKQRAATALVAIASVALLATAGLRIWRFAVESADYDTATAGLQPQQRALALIFDTTSPASANHGAYVHHALWYQVEHQGLVDFNFAWVQPQVLRYRVATRPAVAMDLAWHPRKFSWSQHDGGAYRYFIVRHSGEVPSGLFDGAPCPPALVAGGGRWQVYERRGCATAPNK